MGWIGSASNFNNLIFIYLFKYETIETHARAFLPLNISAIGTVYRADILEKISLVFGRFEDTKISF